LDNHLRFEKLNGCLTMTASEGNGRLEVSIAKEDADFLKPILSDVRELSSAYRTRKRTFDSKSVHPADVEEESNRGWEVQRVGIRSARIKRPKTHNRWLEDRLWCLFYSMGYRTLNGENFKISFHRADGSTGRKQVDVYAEDDETVIVVECKSREERGRRSLQKDIQETISLQNHFRNSIIRRYAGKSKPKIIWVYATSNILWSTPDIERAESSEIKIITENELQYFETFVKHMGPAGKYQILGEFLGGQKVPGLADVKLPPFPAKSEANPFIVL